MSMTAESRQEPNPSPGRPALEKFEILVIGRGKLATELVNALRSPAIDRVIPWDERDRVGGGRCIVVHAGSGRELGDAVAFCADKAAMLLDLSTGDSRLPAAPDFPLIVCPNVNMRMLGFMAMVRQASKYFRGQDIRITESHQASKSTKPGTAVHLARSLGVPEDEIRSERNPKAQAEVLSIPSAYLDRHAYHEILISDPEVEIRLQTRVLGKAAYASGLARIIEKLSGSTPPSGLHDIVDLLIDDFEAPLGDSARSGVDRK